MIYKRFTEKSAEEWRQIYKALQLMEFLVKNGSERVIDDARSHLSLLKMLRQFHYIDQNGKDQGINVRNRSKELTDLLSDVDRIRQERKKARATKNKYTGVEGGAGLGPSSSGGRYGGFGSESAGYGASSFGGTTRGVYGDGGGFGGESHEDYDESGRRGGADRFDEYDEYDDGGAQAPPARRETERPSRSAAKKAEPAKPKEPEVDLFDFGDDEPATTSAPVMSAPSNGTSASAVLSPPTSAVAPAEDDDFDDFQSATPSTTSAPAPAAAPSIPKPNYSSFSTATPTPATQYAQPTPQQGGNNQAAFSNIFATTSRPSSTAASSAFSPPPQQKPAGAGYQPTGPNYFTSVQIQPQASGTSAPGVASVTSPLSTTTSNTSAAAAKKPAAGGDAFANLLGGGAKRSGTPSQKGQTLADMAKAKTQAGLYGANAPSMAQQPAFGQGQQRGSGGTGSQGLDDLLG